MFCNWNLRACFLFGAIISTNSALAEQGLNNCSSAFPGASITNAPASTSPGADTVKICERSGSRGFFALEYDSVKYAPLWVGYRIADTFGPNGCASMTREQMRCHFGAEDVESCIAQKRGLPDPFHTDEVLKTLNAKRLGPNAYSGTGHDRGHMGPNSTFSWHACAAYKSFTMANMAAQWGSLNQQLWARLEAQVLFWGINDGPIYVVTGPIWSRFPATKFESIRSGRVKTGTFAKANQRLKKTNGTALPVKILRPTGFYKVVLREGKDGEPDRAIAFLVPHTKQTKLSFWEFLSTVELVEDSAKLKFGFAEELKGGADLAFWRDRGREAPSKWDPRKNCQARMPIAGWMADRSPVQRAAVCASDNEP